MTMTAERTNSRACIGAQPDVAPLKILYVGGLSPNDSSQYRLWALERLGHRVVPLNAFDFIPGNTLLGKITLRLQAGPSVERLNRDLLRLARQEQPDVVWTDKLLAMQPERWTNCARLGIADGELHDRQPLRNAPGPGLEALHEGHSAL